MMVEGDLVIIGIYPDNMSSERLDVQHHLKALKSFKTDAPCALIMDR